MRVAEKIGWDLGCLVDVEVDEGLRVAKEHNYAAVEIMGDESLSDLGLRGLWPWEGKVWNVIRPMLDSFQFKAYHSPYYDVNFLTLNPVIRETSLEQIKRAIDTAAEMGLNPVIIHPGNPRGDMDERVVELLLFTSLQEVAKYAEEKEVQVAVECCEYLTNLSLLHHYISRINSPYLGICLDINEEMIKLNELDTDSLCRQISDIVNSIFHVRLHVKTNDQSNDMVDKIVQTLMEKDYQGALIFRDNMVTSEGINRPEVVYKVG